MTNIVTRCCRLLAIFSLSILIFPNASLRANAQTPAADAGTLTSSIVPIGPSDPLNVSVIGEPDLTNTYIVDAAGDIQMPYVGKVRVGGLTPDEAATLIQKKLSDIYTAPQVTVVRSGLGGITVTVIGAVTHQGNNTLRRDAHLNDVVQLAAPTADADLKHINVTHGLPGQRHTTDTYDLDSFLNTASVSGNPSLMDGDTVFIPKSTQSLISVSVTGEVAKAGRFNVAPGSTAFDAIALAGGLDATADAGGTYVQAMGSTTQNPFNYTTAAQNPSNAQLNPILKDGDQVVVPMATTLPTYAITGAVLKPGEYPVKGVVTLLDAISLAGGLEDRAKAKQTKITRTTPKGPVVLEVDASDTKAAATTYLQAGDTIQIPHGNQPHSTDPLNVLGALGSILAVLRL